MAETEGVNDELKLLRLVAAAALKLQHGCDCIYDYRCGRCEQLHQIRELAAQAISFQPKKDFESHEEPLDGHSQVRSQADQTE